MNSNASIKVKICGLTTVEAVASVGKAKADYAGFVFFPASPRNVAPERANVLASTLPPEIKTVAVVVDPTDNDLEKIFAAYRPHYWQLHGNETPERVKAIHDVTGIPVIKAIRVSSGDDIAKAGKYGDVAEMLLFDARVDEGLPGGNGMSFDWMLLRGKEFRLPWFLSGGLNSQNITEAVSMSGAGMVDVSSSLEIRPGIKDPGLIEEFMKAAKQ